MSRKLILSLAAIATLATAAITSAPAYAHSGGGHSSGGHSGGGHSGGGHSGHEGHHIGFNHWHHNFHFRYAHDRLYVRPVGYAVRSVDPGPCACLTKNYTPEGMVVFQDLCTKEMASAPVDGSPAHAEAEPQPNNFAGRSYEDYLKANPQAAAPKKN
jgi:hypothetical protein